MKRCVLEEMKEKEDKETPENTKHRKKSFTPKLSEEHKGPNPLVEFPKPATQCEVKG